VHEGGRTLSESMLKMYISFAGIISLFLAVGLIYLSRHKLRGFIAVVVAVLAYLFMIFGGIIIFYIVLSGPTA
jgi:succinate dehydrogenase hydrophobic anchor subunit